MIDFDRVSVTYAGAPGPVLREVDLHLPEGELALLVGPTGSGKTTLLRAVNGLVPHFTGGHLSGRVRVDGRDTRTHQPRELADVVGVVAQDPRAGFVTDVVEDELAYGMECLGVTPPAMRRRVEETLDLLGLADLRDRSLATLSGGQAQRVAIGAVLAAGPRVLVLDEPTSALDPPAAEEVLAALARLVHDLGLTVLLAEHRLERVIHHADTMIFLPGSGAPPVLGPPAEVLALSDVPAPPLVRLGRALGWAPLPVSVRQARREAAPLRAELQATTPSRTPPPGAAPPRTAAQPGPDPASRTRRSGGRAAVVGSSSVGSVLGLVAGYPGSPPALRGVDLALAAGSVTALMGRNGAGKSTLLGCLAGLLPARSGTVLVGGRAPHGRRGRELVCEVGLVPQDPTDLLYAASVGLECRLADTDTGLPAGTTAAALDRLVPGLDPDRHPRDLSEGQRLALALAVVLATAPPLLLLDEPTRGLDYAAKARLAEVLAELRSTGHAVLVATHDVELAADVADRVVVLADGEVVADGPAAQILVGSPAFAPQVAKVMHPVPVLTVADLLRDLAELPAGQPVRA